MYIIKVLELLLTIRPLRRLKPQVKINLTLFLNFGCRLWDEFNFRYFAFALQLTRETYDTLMV